jgi:hypothetical protein
MLKEWCVFSGWLLLAMIPAAHATEVKAETVYENVVVLVLAPVDGRAVVQDHDGELHLLVVGDALPETAATVVQILGDRLVVEEPADGPAPARRVWIYRERDAEGRARVQVLDPEAPPQPPVYRPLPLDPPAPGSGVEVKHGR